MTMLHTNDQATLNRKGISQEQLEYQIQKFTIGFAYTCLHQPATPGKGIIQLSPQETEPLVEFYDQQIAQGLKATKFIPASGAATRMFKSLFEFDQSSTSEQAKKEGEEPMHAFFSGLKDFAFYPALKNKLSGTPTPSELVAKLLHSHGLDYGQKPKGVLAFHHYPQYVLTAAEEHLFEGVAYAREVSGNVNLHFTVSPEHLQLFQDVVQPRVKQIEVETGIQFHIVFSFQKSSTDTVAVNPDNSLFRNEKDELVFRPAGHGALIENLNEIDSDVIFIKNIDNVAEQSLLPETVQFKKALAAKALQVQKTTFNLLRLLEKPVPEHVQQAREFLLHELKLPNVPTEVEGVHALLNRPIRVCGMVKNEGEPGGGPFWVLQPNGSIQLQIVESAQVDLKNSTQKALFEESTHFNPVDLVCLVKDYKGNKFELTQFVDHEAGFISEKSFNGKPLKAMELPGLWNGAMANWLTLFVEVPPNTFNPVKTVMDLLRKAHQHK